MPARSDMALRGAKSDDNIKSQIPGALWEVLHRAWVVLKMTTTSKNKCRRAPGVLRAAGGAGGAGRGDAGCGRGGVWGGGGE